jgi:hypothetical protein
MDLREESSAMSFDDEISHWWFQTRFKYIDKAISFIDNGDLKIIEYGCGTAQNLFYLSQNKIKHKEIRSLVGIDPNIKDEYIPKWLETDGGIQKFNRGENTFNLLLAMDVLEHIEKPEEELKNWIYHLDPGSIVLITLPAFMHLWSHHDNYLGHKKRYTIKSMNSLAEGVGLKKLYSNYFFSHIYIPALIIRKIFRNEGKTSDLRKNNFIINAFLRKIGTAECYFNLPKPFGTSVVGIFMKK